jgi:hypothetical protein
MPTRNRKRIVSWGAERGWQVRLTNSPQIFYIMRNAYIWQRCRSSGTLTGTVLCRSCSYLTGNTYILPGPITAIVLFFIRILSSYLTENTYGPPRPLTGIALLLYVNDVPTSQETHLYTSMTSYPLICGWCLYLTGNTPLSFHGLLRR